MYVYLLADNKHWIPSLSTDIVRKARAGTHTKHTKHSHKLIDRLSDFSEILYEEAERHVDKV